LILNGQLCKLTYQHLCKREIGFVQLFFVVFRNIKIVIFAKKITKFLML